MVFEFLSEIFIIKVVFYKTVLQKRLMILRLRCTSKIKDLLKMNDKRTPMFIIISFIVQN